MSPAGPGGFAMNFDANGQPSMGDVSALAGGVRSGSVNTIKGSADQLLATGTHGTAIITTAMPLGKTVRDINPAADPSRLNDPVWIFTVECDVPGQGPFPAVFGHCLLYTSDAADDLLCVDLGGRRIIKTKKN